MGHHAGGILGIVTMRLVTGQLIKLVERYPSLVNSALVIIAWVGVKLCVDYLHVLGVLAFEISQLVSVGLIVVIFVVALVRALMEGPVETVTLMAEQAEGMLDAQAKQIEKDRTT